MRHGSTVFDKLQQIILLSPKEIPLQFIMINYEEIEKTVDNWIGERPESILDILDAIATSCRNTSEHLESNWQDRKSAKQWDKIASKIEKVRESIPEMLPF